MNQNLMEVNLKNKRCLFTMLILGLNGFFAYAYMQFTTPVVSEIVAAQGFTDQTMIGLISTIPGITIIPGILFCGLVSKKINPKTLFMIGGLITAVGGFATGYCSNLTLMVILRAVVGFGTGFNMILINGFIPYFFETKSVTFLFGWTNAFGNILGSLQALLAAWVVVQFGWRASFTLYLLAFIPMALTAFCLPKIPMEKQPAEEKTVEKREKNAPRRRVSPMTYVLGLLGFCGWLFANVMWANVSIYLSAEGIGTVTQAGTASSMITFIATFAALIVAPLYQQLRRYTMPLFVGLIGLAGLCFYLAKSIALIYVGCVLLGVWIGIMGPCILTLLAECNSKENTTLSQSIVNVFIFVGLSSSTYWCTFLTKALHATSLRPVQGVNALVCAVVVILLLVFITVDRSYRTPEEKAAQKQ